MVDRKGQSSAICHPSSKISLPRMCPRHLNLFHIALESGVKLNFLYSILFKIRRVSRVPRTIRRQLIWKTSRKSSSAFRSTHASEPYLTTVITVASKILIFAYGLIIFFFLKFLTVKKKFPEP